MKKSCFNNTKEIYAEWGVDVEKAIETALNIPISVHCWQGDDLTGFISNVDSLSDGGIMSTGNFPGKAKTAEQLRNDLDTALSYIPGKVKVNLHSVYAETTKKIDLSEIETSHFTGWIDWANNHGYGLDFNPTCFSHPMAKSGYTLASKDKNVRKFWIEHVKKCREIGANLGEKTGKVCINNIWIPDGAKDTTIDKIGYRTILTESLDEILKVKYDENFLRDTVESKLFGIGSESFVVGSYEYYLLYALTRNVIPCLDMGHFHPTESVGDKISAMAPFIKNVQLHVSRGVRWDSDHVAILNTEMISLMQEIRRANFYDRTFIALDYFDASINRIMAWVVGTRAARKAILYSLLEPYQLLKNAEEEENFGRRLAVLEESKSMPFAAVWNELCERENIDHNGQWITDVEKYLSKILKER